MSIDLTDDERKALWGLPNQSAVISVVETLIAARVVGAVERERAARLALVAKIEAAAADFDERVGHVANGVNPYRALLTADDTKALDAVKAEAARDALLDATGMFGANASYPRETVQGWLRARADRPLVRAEVLMTSLTINVVGTPAPQGSKKGFYNQKVGRVQMVESSKKVAPWRQDVVAAIEQHLAQDYIKLDGPNGGIGWGPEIRDNLPWTMPLAVEVVFYIARPGYHYRTGKHAGELKPGAPVFVDKKPDGDKLLRSTLDALTTSGLIRDDAQIADLRGIKRYADHATGARITITPLVSPADGASPSPAAAGETPTQRQEVLFP